MAQHNTHRTPGRATTPVTGARRAARGLGGAAVLGTVLVGTAFTGGAAHAGAPADAAPAAPAAQTAPAAPVATTPAQLTWNSTLFQSSAGDRVAILQANLNLHGADLAEDGKFGPATHRAVLDYQAAHGLQVDGRVGPETRASLNGHTSAGAPAAAPAEASSGSSATGSSIVDRARSAIGTHYTYGGDTPAEGLDCSGLVNYAYAQSGVELPRTAGAIADGGQRISQSEAQPGDILAWPGHVAIYAGDGRIIDASGSQRIVVERSVWGDPTYISYR